MTSAIRLSKRARSGNEFATSREAAFRDHGPPLSFTLLIIFVGSLFAAPMAGYVLYLTAVARAQAPVMNLVGIMAAFGLLAVVLLGLLIFALHPRTERMGQSEIRESEQDYQALFENAPMGMALTTCDGRILANNEALAKMLDFNEKEVQRLEILSIYRDSDDRRHFLDLLQLHGCVENFESHLRRRDGTTFVANLTARWLLWGGEKVLFTVFQDITDRKLAEGALTEAKRKMEVLASLDGLTGIANRRFFDERLEVEWKRAFREKTSLSLIIADIDFFKAFNDTNGHLAGDDCLKKVAKVLQGSLRRPTDLVARYGGEEFVALLPNTGFEGALRLAKAMRLRVRSLAIAHPDSSVGDHITVSLGVAATVPRVNALHTELIEAADSALYEAKREGRDCIRTSSVALRCDENLRPRSHIA